MTATRSRRRAWKRGSLARTAEANLGSSASDCSICSNSRCSCSESGTAHLPGHVGRPGGAGGPWQPTGCLLASLRGCARRKAGRRPMATSPVILPLNSRSPRPICRSRLRAEPAFHANGLLAAYSGNCLRFIETRCALPIGRPEKTGRTYDGPPNRAAAASAAASASRQPRSGSPRVSCAASPPPRPAPPAGRRPGGPLTRGRAPPRTPRPCRTSPAAVSVGTARVRERLTVRNRRTGP